jgi:hypothetical protein
MGPLMVPCSEFELVDWREAGSVRGGCSEPVSLGPVGLRDAGSDCVPRLESSRWV